MAATVALFSRNKKKYQVNSSTPGISVVLPLHVHTRYTIHQSRQTLLPPRWYTKHVALQKCICSGVFVKIGWKIHGLLQAQHIFYRLAFCRKGQQCSSISADSYHVYTPCQHCCSCRIYVLIFGLYSSSRCTLYISNICGHTPSSGRHQPAAAKPPLYQVWYSIVYKLSLGMIGIQYCYSRD